MTDACEFRGEDRQDAMALSILIVSFNTHKLALECLASVTLTVRSTHEIIVVDNASTDGSVAAIAAQFPQARLHALAENVGFARAVNWAASLAKGEFLLLLNSDTVALDGAIDRLVRHAAAGSESGIWGGRTLFQDGGLNPTSCW